jgi:NADPH-dependent curcumin reductase CurA
LKSGAFLPDMFKWINEKKISIHETFFDGIEQYPSAFVSVMSGTHIGKVVIRIK